MWRFLARIESLIAIATTFLMCFAWDYNHYGDFQRHGRIKVLLFGAAGLAAMRIGKCWHWTFAAFYAYVVASFLHFGWSPWGLPTPKGVVVFVPNGMEEVLCLSACLFLIPELCRRVSRCTIEEFIILAGLINALVGGMNLFGFYAIKLAAQPPENLPVGLMGQHTLLGPLLVFCAALSVCRGLETRQLEFHVLAVFLTAVAMATRSSMTIASLGAGALVLVLYYRGPIAAFLLSVAGLSWLFLAVWFLPELGELSGRILPWQDAWSLHVQRPWFGFGIGSWEPLAGAIRDLRGQAGAWTYLHSEPLQGLFELGVVGMLLAFAAGLVVATYAHFLYLFRSRESVPYIAGLAILLVNSAANFTLHIVPLGPLAMLCAWRILDDLRGYEG